MWFLNKTTGLKWEVTNEELIKRLTKDEHYEEITIATKATNTASKTKSNEEK